MLRNSLFILLLLVLVSPIYGQLGSRYAHVDTLHVNTSANDTTWTTAWEQVVLTTDTADVYIKIGAPDVGSWASRDWFLLRNGSTLTIGPSPKLKKIEYKTLAGSAVLYILGYKKERQY